MKKKSKRIESHVKNFIEKNAVLFPNATGVLLAQYKNGCHLYVPVVVADDEKSQQEAKYDLQTCIDKDDDTVAEKQPPPDDDGPPSAA